VPPLPCRIAYAAAVPQASVEELSATFRALAARQPATQQAAVAAPSAPRVSTAATHHAAIMDAGVAAPSAPSKPAPAAANMDAAEKRLAQARARDAKILRDITHGGLVVCLGADAVLRTGVRQAGPGSGEGALEGLSEPKIPTKDVLHAFAGLMGFKRGSSTEECKNSCSSWLRAKAEKPFWFFGMCTCMPTDLWVNPARLEAAKAAWPLPALQNAEKRVACLKHPRARL